MVGTTTTRGRLRRFRGLVTAVLVVALGAAATGCGSDEESAGGEAPSPSASSSAPTSDPSSAASPSEPPSSAGGPSVTRLTEPAPVGNARCAVPTPAIVGQQDVAFDGTVTDVAGRTVTLEPTTFYTGPATDEVQVRAPSKSLGRLVGTVDFEQGERYLVAASDGQVALCLISDRWSRELAGTYEQAFGG